MVGAIDMKTINEFVFIFNCSRQWLFGHDCLLDRIIRYRSSWFITFPHKWLIISNTISTLKLSGKFSHKNIVVVEIIATPDIYEMNFLRNSHYNLRDKIWRKTDWNTKPRICFFLSSFLWYFFSRLDGHKKCEIKKWNCRRSPHTIWRILVGHNDLWMEFRVHNLNQLNVIYIWLCHMTTSSSVLFIYFHLTYSFTREMPWVFGSETENKVKKK